MATNGKQLTPSEHSVVYVENNSLATERSSFYITSDKLRPGIQFFAFLKEVFYSMVGK